jgi:hypothetical protein
MRILTTLAVATIFASTAAAQSHDHPPTPVPPSAESEQAFKLIKSVSGVWQGRVTEPVNKLDAAVDVAMRVTSRGNLVVHEIKATADSIDNPLKNDHPVSVMYVDGANLLLTHYCDSGNRPRMSARVSPDGKSVEFFFKDIVGPTKYGHMAGAKFTFIDPTHHIEEWTWELPDGKTFVAHFDLKRVSEVATITAK